jgi:hypothetical protein
MSQHHDITDTDTAARLQRENDGLANMIASLEARMPTEEDMAYLRNRREQDERSAWVWQVIRQHAPWVIGIGSAIGTVVYWFLTHTITIRSE